MTTPRNKKKTEVLLTLKIHLSKLKKIRLFVDDSRYYIENEIFAPDRSTENQTIIIKVMCETPNKSQIENQRMAARLLQKYTHSCSWKQIAPTLNLLGTVE